MHSELALVASGVSKRYGEVHALRDVSLAVTQGECVALVGESGSGKTTLLRCFNRMVQTDEGSVLVRGRNVTGQDPVSLRRSIGYVPQEGGLFPHWRVTRNAALVPWLQGREDAAELAEQSLELVGLPAGEFGRRWPRQLSGGQRQRVAIARALAAGPGIMLLDEPFGALDAITRSDLQSAFRDLRSELGITTLLVTHDLREAVLLADRIAVLHEGRIEQAAPAEELMSAPATDYVKTLLARARVTRGG